MSKALAWYFAILGIYEAVGASFDPFDGRATVRAVVGIVVWFALAAGLYRRYRAARIAAVGVCTVMAGTGIILWFISGFQHHLLLIAAIASGVPLIGLLHPRASTEFVRVFRIPGRPTNE